VAFSYKSYRFDIEDRIVSVARSLSVGVPPEQIRESWLEKGIEEYDFFLVFCAASILVQDRESAFDEETNV
jgi:hypothetical protein